MKLKLFFEDEKVYVKQKPDRLFELLNVTETTVYMKWKICSKQYHWISIILMNNNKDGFWLRSDDLYS